MDSVDGKNKMEVTELICKERMQHVTDDLKLLSARVERYEGKVDDIHKLSLSLERITVTLESAMTSIHEHGERLDRIESRDGEKWKDMMRYIATAIVGAVLGFVLKSMGIG